ncbi:MAG: serine/threonine-protein kinase [Planctomycetota bacterium]
MKSEIHLDAELLRRHLNEELEQEQASLINEHLSDCAECRQRIAEIAAGSDWWNAAAACLGDVEIAVLDPGDAPESGPSDELWFVESQQVVGFLNPTDDPTKMGRLGTYEVVGIIGAGATAVVLKALDPALNRYVAIKLMRPTLAASPTTRQRFAREARAAAAIIHENVIEIYGVSQVKGLPYLVMPYARGESLASRIRRQGPLNTEAVLNIACQVADGLAAAHANGLVHRDVKPSNILLGDGVERLKLTDFGLARAVDDVGLTRSGTLAGTPEYMSPEQASGDSVDHRSDLFSLGSVIHTMCTGQPPFTSDSCYGVLRRIVEDEPPSIRESNPDVPPWLSRLVDQLMQKDPAGRLSDATVVSQSLRSCLAHLHDPSHPLPDSIRPTSRRRRAVSLLGVTLVAVVVVASIVSQRDYRGKPRDGVETLAVEVAAMSNESESASGLSASQTGWNDGVGQVIQGVASELAEYERNHGQINPRGDEE